MNYMSNNWLWNNWNEIDDNDEVERPQENDHYKNPHRFRLQ